MNPSAEVKNDLYTLIFAELKTLGVKVPKTKKFKLNIIKQEKCLSTTGCKIFGASLSDQEFVSDSGGILPKFIAEATAYLRGYSEVAIGLFRKAGSIPRQRELRRKLEKGGSLEGSEPNDVASLLKQWLRELPEPIIPNYLHDLLIRCLNLETHEKKSAALLLTCLLLRSENLYTLKHLLQFLADVAANSDKNKMDLHNLALIMAPNLLKTGNERLDKLSYSLVQTHTSLVELLIEICPQFGELPVAISSQLNGQILQNEDLDYSSDDHLGTVKTKKRRRSGPVQEIFSGIRKFVGQTWTPGGEDRLVTPSHQASVSRSALKRKADRDLCLLSPSKKQALSNANNQNLEIPIVTPGGKVTEIIGRKHSRGRSFNLLRRKDRKGNRSENKSCSRTLSPSVKNHPTPLVVNAIIEQTNQLQNDFLKVIETPLTRRKSSSVSPSEMQFLTISQPSIKKSTSDYLIKKSHEDFKGVKKITSSSSQGNLPNKPIRSSPYYLRSDDLIIKSSEINQCVIKLPGLQNNITSATLKKKPSIKRNESTRRSSRRKPIVKNVQDMSCSFKSANVSDYSALLDSSYQTGIVNDVSYLEDNTVTSQVKRNLSFKSTSGSEEIQDKDILLADSVARRNLVIGTGSKGKNNRRSFDDVFVQGSPKRSSTRSIKSEHKSISTSQVVRSISQKKSVHSTMNTTKSKLCSQNSDSQKKIITDRCGNHSVIGMSPSTRRVSDVPKAKLDTKKVKSNLENLKQETLLIRNNSSRRRKKEITHAKSLDYSKNEQFKSKFAATNRSLRKENGVPPKEITMENEQNCVQSLLNVSTDKCTPQKNRLLRREVKSSLRRGRPNTIKSGLPSELCPRYNNPVAKSDHDYAQPKSIFNDLSLNESDSLNKTLKTDESDSLNKTLKTDESDSLNKTFKTDESDSLDKTLKTDESVCCNKTLLEDICDTLDISLLNEKTEDLSFDLVSEDKFQALEKSAIEISNISIEGIVTRQSCKAKRCSSLNLPAPRNKTALSELKTNCSKKKFLSSSGSKIPRAIKTSHELIRIKSHESFTSMHGTKELEKEKKQQRISTSSYDELQINLSKKSKRNSQSEYSIGLSDCNIFKSPLNVLDENDTQTTWVSATKYLDSNALNVDDKACCKRESIVQILKNNSGHVLAKVSQYDYVARSTPESSKVGKRSQSSQKLFKTPNSVNLNSAKRASSTKGTTTKILSMGPPPKFVITDSCLASPKVSYPLKELTNVDSSQENLQMSAGQPLVSPTYNNTPTKDEKRTRKSTERLNQTNLKANKIKPKRNSYSGHTPFKLKDLARSESSPMLAKNSHRIREALY